MTPYEIFMEAFDLCASHPQSQPVDSHFDQRFEFAINQASLIYGDTIAIKCVKQFFQKHQLKDLIK